MKADHDLGSPAAASSISKHAAWSNTARALDNLRGVVILLVVAFHCFTAYLCSQPASPPAFDQPPYDWLANPIIDGQRWLGFDIFCASQFLYLMQLLFFLSGLFVWSSLLRKGCARFLHDRFLRLGAPFLLGTFLLIPLTYYPVYRVTAANPGWSAFWEHWTALPFWPSGPMWFLWVLLALNIVAAGIDWIAPRSGAFMAQLGATVSASPGRLFAGIAGASALTYLPLAAVVTTPWQWAELGPFALQPGLVPQYVVYFFAGLAIGAYGLERSLLRCDGMLARRWALWSASAVAAFLLWIVPTASIVEHWSDAFPIVRIVADFGFVLYVVCAGLAVTAMCLRFAAKRGPLLGTVSEHAYGIYLFHYLFVIWTQYALLDLPVPAVAKAAIVLAVTLSLSFAASAAMCRVPLAARMIGGPRPMSTA
jgi:peptidoglycan/LPS O-acetylase OafA/YrhL